MLPIHTIVYPTDFSKRSEHAFHLAAALARDYGAQLVVVHVMPPSLVAYGEGVVLHDPEGYQESLRDKLHQYHVDDTRVGMVYRLHEGDPAFEIVRLADEMKADLIVMGTHGRTGLTRLLLGSVAEHVLRKATCPVMTVKAAVPAAEAAPQQPEQMAAAAGR